MKPELEKYFGEEYDLSGPEPGSWWSYVEQPNDRQPMVVFFNVRKWDWQNDDEGRLEVEVYTLSYNNEHSYSIPVNLERLSIVEFWNLVETDKIQQIGTIQPVDHDNIE